MGPTSTQGGHGLRRAQRVCPRKGREAKHRSTSAGGWVLVWSASPVSFCSP